MYRLDGVTYETAGAAIEAAFAEWPDANVWFEHGDYMVDTNETVYVIEHLPQHEEYGGEG